MALTLHDFEATLGTYNRGNIQLGDEPNATLRVVNNHRWKTDLNNVQSDAAANRRVRTALLAALTGDGRLSAEYVTRVRAELLGEGHETADLTRVQLKTFLDAHKVARAVGERMKAVFEEPTEDFHPAAASDVFDNMTTRAARQATEIFSSRAFIRLLPANLTPEFRQQLEEDAMLAEAGLHEIYGLTGADLVAGNVAIGNGIATTVDRLATLADDLRKLYNADAIPENRAFFEEMIHYATARGTEIQNVYLTSLDLVQRRQVDPVRNAKTLRALVGEEALAMHGTDDFLKIIRTAIKPLLTELAEIRAAGENAPIPAGRLLKLTDGLKRARAVVGHATTDGIAFKADEKAVFLADKSLTKELEKVLDDALATAGALAKANARRQVRTLLEGVFTTDVITPKLFHAYRDQYAALMRSYQKLIREKIFDAATPDLTVFDKISLDLSARRLRGPVIAFAPESVQHLKTLVQTMLQAEGTATEATSAQVEAALKGEIGVGSLVGARTYGFELKLVDPKVDDRFVTEEKSFGKGNVNEVTRLVYTYPDGTRQVRIFKPEVNAMEGMHNMPLGKGYPDTMQVARINAANREAAELLGIPEVAVRVTVGMHNGVFGFFMDEAPGATGYEAIHSRGKDPAKGRLAGLLSFDTFPTLSRADQLKVLSPVLKGFTDLEWLDWLTGQMDRHGDNYKIVVNDDFTGSVQGIDNDGAFPAYRMGLYTYRFDAAGAERALLDALGLGTRQDLLAKYPGKVREENHVLVVNCEDDKELTWGVYKTFGLNSSSKPHAISKDMYDKLLAIANPEAWVENLLGAHFTPAQKAGTVARLREMIAYAKTLDPNTQVLSKDDWKNSDRVLGVYRKIVGRFNRLSPGMQNDEEQKNLFDLEVDYWARDFLLQRPFRLKRP